MAIYPKKLKPGAHLRIISPARSLALIAPAQREIALNRLTGLGLKVTFGKHVEERDEFHSSSIESRIEDLHEAFSDPGVDGIMTVIGGFNSNQLLRYIDWDLIKNNPKIFCGYSDITALQNSIYAKTGLVTYSGPHFSTFGMKQRFDFTLEHFQKCLFQNEPFELKASEHWSDDPWYQDQDNRNFLKNPGFQVIQQGETEGTIIGANLCTFNLLQGTEYLPGLKDAVLFIEDDEMSGEMTGAMVDRDLQSIIHQPGFSGVKGILIGRFQKRSEMTPSKLKKIIESKRELTNLPVIAGVDFGHTDPYITFPVGGTIRIKATPDETRIQILKH